MLDSGTLIIASPQVTEEACFSVPAVRALHFAKPNSPLTILCPNELAPLWETVEGVSEVIAHPASASHRQIGKLIGDYSQALVWEKGPAAVAFAKKGITKRFGPFLEKRPKWLTHSIKMGQKLGPIEHRVKHYLLLVEKLGAQPFEAANFQTPPRPPLPDQLRIGIAPGSDFGPSAEWSLENFRELARRLQGELLIFTSTGCGASKALADLGRVIPTDQALNELAICHLVIGNDGAIPHLAAHVGTPCVVLFGPNEPAWKRPLGKIHRLIRHHVACSPCFLNKCQIDQRCLSGITVDEVIKEVSGMLPKPSL